MEKLEFRQLKSPADRDEYLDKVEYFSGVRLSTTYADQSKIVGAFYKNRLVAGYMLVTKPNYRSLLFVPDSIKSSDAFFRNDSFEMMEVNGLWIGPSLKTPRLQMRVWMQLIKDIFICKKHFVLLMRDARNKTMEKFMGMANPVNLYTGPSQQMAGDKTHNEIEVSVTTRWKIILNMHKYSLELLRRQRKALANSKYRESNQSVKVRSIEVA